MLHFRLVSFASFNSIVSIILWVKVLAERRDTLHVPTLATVVLLTKTAKPCVTVMFFFIT